MNTNSLKLIFFQLLFWSTLTLSNPRLDIQNSIDSIAIDSINEKKLKKIYNISNSGFIIDIVGTSLSVIGYSTFVTAEDLSISMICGGYILRGIGTLMNNCAASVARDKYTDDIKLKSNKIHWGMFILTGAILPISYGFLMLDFFKNPFGGEFSPFGITGLILFMAKDLPWSISNILAYKVTRKIHNEYQKINIQLNPVYNLKGKFGVSLMVLF